MPSDESDFSKFRFKSPDIVDRNWLEWFREEYGRRYISLDIELAQDIPPHFDVTTRLLPGLAFATISVSRMLSTNIAALATSDDLVIGLPLHGEMTVRSGGEPLALGGSKMMLLAADLDHQVEFHTPMCGLFSLRIERRLVAPLVPNLADALAKSFDRNSPAARLLLGYLRSLDAEETMPAAETSHVVATHVCDLLALALGASRDATAAASVRGARAARLAAIKADVLENLAHHDLSAASVAARNGVTRRYVDMLLETEGATFSEFVLDNRLARAHRMLTDLRFAHHSISAISLQVGFGDLSYFNRTFRRRFGATPSDVREAARRP